MMDDALLTATKVTRTFGGYGGCRDISLSLWPGEVLGIVGESGSGKTTLLRSLAGLDRPDTGRILFRHGEDPIDIYAQDESKRRALMRTEWGMVHQNPRDGLRLEVSAGANIGESLMAKGERHYGRIRASVQDWLARVEIDPARIDDNPKSFSGGMQQRLQIARVLVAEPRLVLMDEPTGGLDVSVQAKLLDLLRVLVRDLGIAAIVVTHDLAVARLLTDRLIVMKDSRIIEEGLTDQVLDDPHHAYTQLLTSAVLSA
ncbi:putative phosphonate transport system ATP-binding protein [Rhizomicrobium palustre]|uniref:Putative phosphonate transport system ATP-binding protein n=1 Tax=Rhizomicrobium palustre TaxID=189966 RepID=A0A846N3K9_9PROT|nr:phosphonate C-P lyase system protein PhnK [Rhizomicrobium palustre]NIK89802.1 putative phosphonate transport system ATP-binding protein [Rhizomicrobium palustre]